MFTGLIEEVGELTAISSAAEKRYFKIQCKKILSDIKIGSSVACDGICLTVIKKNSDSIQVEAMNETIKKTTAKYWEIGKKINLERALKVSDRLEGHFVLGHIDTVGQISGKSYEGNTLYLEFIIPEDFYSFIVEQGSVAVNGISLTIAEITDYGFKIALIGHTIENTNLRYEKDYVNLEFDVIGKYVLNSISKFETEDDEKFIKKWLEDNNY